MAVRWLALALGAAAATWLVFARDPQRTTPAGPGLLVAPADGRVLTVEPVEAAPPLAGWQGPGWRMVIFLSLWDVHVQRAPEGGLVTLSMPQAGDYAPAMTQAAAGNAGHWLGLATPMGQVLVLRAAGLLVRRVTTRVQPGDSVARGQRIGRIWLGSRCEVYLPQACIPAVRVNQRVRAGESIIARASQAP